MSTFVYLFIFVRFCVAFKGNIIIKLYLNCLCIYAYTYMYLDKQYDSLWLLKYA